MNMWFPARQHESKYLLFFFLSNYRLTNIYVELAPFISDMSKKKKKKLFKGIKNPDGPITGHVHTETYFVSLQIYFAFWGKAHIFN